MLNRGNVTARLAKAPTLLSFAPKAPKVCAEIPGVMSRVDTPGFAEGNYHFSPAPLLGPLGRLPDPAARP